MGAARTIFATLGVTAVVGLSAVAGLAARDKRDYPQTYAQGGVPRLLASRVGPLDIGEEDYFRELSNLLKEFYVEPVTDDRKLLAGAVRGMVTSLGDRDSLFFSREEFRAYKAMRQGRFEGIGAWIGFVGGAGPTDADGVPEDQAARTPRLTVLATTPAGPADRAGVRVGDAIEEVNGEWVVNSEPILAFRKLQKEFAAKKIPLATITAARKDLKSKLDRSMMPLKARERLILGTSGTVALTLSRGGKVLPAMTIRKAVSEAGPPVRDPASAVPLLFNDGASERLAAAIRGRANVTLDLRGSALGDWDTMRRALAVVAPAGTYGRIERAKGGATALTIAKGNPKPPRLTLLVDAATSGPAKVFALALQGRNLAKIAEGSEAMKGAAVVTEVIQLPDESGYTLATGVFRVGSPTPAKAAKNVGVRP